MSAGKPDVLTAPKEAAAAGSEGVTGIETQLLVGEAGVAAPLLQAALVDETSMGAAFNSGSVFSSSCRAQRMGSGQGSYTIRQCLCRL